MIFITVKIDVFWLFGDKDNKFLEKVDILLSKSDVKGRSLVLNLVTCRLGHVRLQGCSAWLNRMS